MAPRTARTNEVVFYDDFSGGVNLVESPHTLPAPFLPSGSFNVTLRGRQMTTRFGTYLAGTLGASSSYIFYSPKVDLFFSQEGTTLYKYTISATNQALSARTSVKVFTTSAVCQIVEFAGVLVAVHPVDGTFTSSDGTTWTLRSATVKGTCIATWQNKCWVGGDSSNPSRVWWSNAGDATTWTTATDFVDVREVDDRTVTAVGVGNGMDVVGRGGLLVFKANSCYRIYSSSTGAYTTVDSSRGATGPMSITSTQGKVYFINYYGIYRMDGDQVVTISDPIRPGWDVGTQYSQAYVAWTAWDRAYFSNQGDSSTARRMFWELIPERGAWFPHGINTAASTYRSVYGATRYAKGSVAALNTSLLLVDDQTSVVVAPNHPSGVSAAASTAPAPSDLYNGSTGNAIDYRFALPVTHRQLRRFGLREMRVLGWGPGTISVRYAGLQEAPGNAAGTSSFTAQTILNAGRNWAVMPGVNVGAYTSLRAYLYGTASALAVASETQAGGGNLYSPIVSDLRLPAVGIEGVALKIAMQE